MHGYGIVDAADRGMLLARSFLPRSTSINPKPDQSPSLSQTTLVHGPKTASSQRNVGTCMKMAQTYPGIET